MRHLSCFSLILVLGFSACKKDEEDTDDDMVQAIYENEESIKEFIQNISSEAMDISASGSQNDQSGANLNFLISFPWLKSFTKICTTSENTAKVDVNAEIDLESSLVGRIFTVNWTLTGSGSQERTWSKSGNSITCNAGNTYALLPWADLGGLKLALTVDHQAVITSSLTNNNNGNSWTRVATRTLTGSREATWDSVNTDESQVTIEKTISSNVNHIVDILRNDGSHINRNYTVITSDNDPLKITTTRENAQGFAVKSQNIKSGTLAIRNDKSGTISVAMSNIRFDLTSAGVCQLQGGSLNVTFEGVEGNALGTISCTVDSFELSCTSESGSFEVSAPSCNPQNQI